MKRMVLIALMVFCSLLFLEQEKARAIPYTFTWDVSGLMNGLGLGTSDYGSWSARFFIESTDLNWSDAWGDDGMIQNTSGDVAHNIDFFNAVMYDLSLGRSDHVDWCISAGAHVEQSQGRFEWVVDSLNFPDRFGLGSYLEFDPLSTAGSTGYGLVTAESSVSTAISNDTGNVLNRNVHSTGGFSEPVSPGRFGVITEMELLPAPGGLMLTALGIGIVGWLRGRRTL